MASKNRKATVVNCSDLNKRSGAGTSYKVVSSVKKGYTSTVTTSKKVGSSTWYKWKDGTWSNGKYLELEASGTIVTNKDTKNTETKKKKTMINKNKKSSKSTASSVNKADKNGSNFAKYKKENRGSTAVANASDFTSLTSTKNNVSSKLIFNDGYSTKVEGKDDFTLKYSFISKQVNSIKRSFNILSDAGNIKGTDTSIHKAFHMNFNRFKLPYPDVALQKTFGYVFFTRPNCNLLKEDGGLLPDIKKLPEYYYLYKTGHRAFKSLTANYYDATHSFHPLLSNLATSFELSDENIESIEHGESFTGHKIIYGGMDTKSKTGGTFTVGFTDNKYLDIYRIVKLWQMYISDVKRGLISPTRTNIQNKILDYAASAYYILVGPNGEDILFWSKYYGVFPTVSPSSEFSFRKGDLMATPNYSIPFAYSFKKDFSVFSLAEFNMLGKDDFKYRETYDPNILSTGLTWVGAPFIETILHSNGNVSYKLRFRVE